MGQVRNSRENSVVKPEGIRQLERLGVGGRIIIIIKLIL
jgi:hypothetical protein